VGHEVIPVPSDSSGRTAMSSEAAWIQDNAECVIQAVARPEVQQELYELLGGARDHEREREALLRELALLRLTWKLRP
jgi:hypothetical protein